MTSSSKLKKSNAQNWLPWIDVLGFLAWGILLLRYWITGQIRLLIHPNYFFLAIITGIALIGISGLKAWQLIAASQNPSLNLPKMQHVTLFPPNFSRALLVITAILGFLIAPGVLTSETAMQRGVSESLPLTQAQPQSFRASVKPEERSLIEWVRTLNVYPEPDAYSGQKVNVSGFVVYSETLPENYLLLTRFILTCCAVDAYPVALPVKLEQPRTAYPQDTWLEVKGQMITESFNVNENREPPKRQLVIAATAIEKIPTPKDPYGY